MQRSITHQKYLAPFIYLLLFIIYEVLSSIYLFLPPLFAVLFVLFSRAIKKEDAILISLVSFCLLVFEAEKGFLLFSSIIYFTLVHKFIMPKITKNFSCVSCIKVSYVLLSYVGFFIFYLVLANIFLLSTPSLNYYIIYYMVIEFLIVSIL